MVFQWEQTNHPTNYPICLFLELFKGIFALGLFGWSWKGPCFVSWVVYALSAQIRLANCMSLGMIVTLFTCMAHKLTSSNNPTRYASAASWSALNACGATLNPSQNSCMISRTNLLNGAWRINNSVVFWYLLISRKATVPGRNLRFFFPCFATAFLAAAALLAAAKVCTFPPPSPLVCGVAFFFAVCFVRAIFVVLPQKFPERMGTQAHLTIFFNFYHSTCVGLLIFQFGAPPYRFFPKFKLFYINLYNLKAHFIISFVTFN